MAISAAFKRWKQAWPLAKTAASAWVDDYAPSMGAALSYYTMFSLAPLMLLVISIAGLVFGEEAARGALFSQIEGLVGADASAAIQELLAGVSKPEKGITGTVIGGVVLLVGATTVFGELQDAMDRIWRAPARDKTGGVFGLLRSRFLSFGMVLGIAFLLMVSLVLSAAVSALGNWWGGVFGGWEVLAHLVNVAIGFVLTTVVFAMIFKIMPRVKVQWHDVWLGAAVTSAMFTLGRFLIGLYIGKSDIATGFGAAGSLIIVFVWVYYSAQIFLMGAEFTWVYAKSFGSLSPRHAGSGSGRHDAVAAVAATAGQTANATTGADGTAVAPSAALAAGRSGAVPSRSGAVRRQPGGAATWARLAAGLVAFMVLRKMQKRVQLPR